MLIPSKTLYLYLISKLIHEANERQQALQKNTKLAALQTPSISIYLTHDHRQQVKTAEFLNIFGDVTHVCLMSEFDGGFNS
jgi:hypothetical protein